MKVSLVDVDGHNYPNLALMKLSAWHKAHGDEVDWYMPLFSHPDRIYASKVFTFSKDYTEYAPSDPEPLRGGTGYDFTAKLPDEIEQMQPDYSIYPQFDFALGFLTRGCIRNCPWCVVPRKEGYIKVVGDIEKIGVRKKVILMDNNFLAAPEDFVIDQLHKSKRMKLNIDFNQALDARLVNERIATALSKCQWIQYVRFSCDTLGMIEPVKRAMSLLRQNGYRRNILVYTLAKDVESTLKRVAELNKSDDRVNCFCMPYRNLDGDGEIADPELKHLARWCNRMEIQKSCTFAEYMRTIEKRKNAI